MNKYEQPTQFATSAKEAWHEPVGLRQKSRKAARSFIIHATGSFWRPRRRHFIRCLYAHAVFPEHRSQLERWIGWLKNEGEFVDTPSLIELVLSGRKPDGRYFHLSFDDGFANVLENGGPILAEAGVPFTMFVATDLIGAEPGKLNKYNEGVLKYRRPIRTLTWAEVGQAHRVNAEIGCHTRTHARLSNISSDTERLYREVAGAKSEIENVTGRTCESFAWPFGKATDIDDRSLAKIEESGFKICFSAERGSVVPGVTPRYRVPRHQVEFHWPERENRLWALGLLE